MSDVDGARPTLGTAGLAASDGGEAVSGGGGAVSGASESRFSSRCGASPILSSAPLTEFDRLHEGRLSRESTAGRRRRGPLPETAAASPTEVGGGCCSGSGLSLRRVGHAPVGDRSAGASHMTASAPKMIMARLVSRQMCHTRSVVEESPPQKCSPGVELAFVGNAAVFANSTTSAQPGSSTAATPPITCHRSSSAAPRGVFACFERSGQAWWAISTARMASCVRRQCIDHEEKARSAGSLVHWPAPRPNASKRHSTHAVTPRPSRWASGSGQARLE